MNILCERGIRGCCLLVSVSSDPVLSAFHKRIFIGGRHWDNIKRHSSEDYCSQVNNLRFIVLSVHSQGFALTLARAQFVPVKKFVERGECDNN